MAYVFFSGVLEKPIMESDLPSQPSFLSRTRERFMRTFLKRGLPQNQSELAKVIEQAGQDEIINEDTEDMIRGVFDISQRRIADIMIPRANIVAIDSQSTIAQAIEIIKKHGHSRYPVTNEDKDHIVGILLAKDLLPLATLADKKISEFEHLLRKAVFVPESKRVNMMLRDFQKDHLHLALAIDEYGGVCGLVTIEDIIELIVGEITDEYDPTETVTCIAKTGENTYTIQGTTPLEEFAEYFKTTLPEVDVDTVAGLVIHLLGHIPHQDESTTFNEFTFKVLNSNLHQVRTLLVTVNPKDEDDE